MFQAFSSIFSQMPLFLGSTKDYLAFFHQETIGRKKLYFGGCLETSLGRCFLHESTYLVYTHARPNWEEMTLPVDFMLAPEGSWGKHSLK